MGWEWSRVLDLSSQGSVHWRHLASKAVKLGVYKRQNVYRLAVRLLASSRVPSPPSEPYYISHVTNKFPIIW